MNKSEDIFENAKFHSPSADAEKDKLPTVTHRPRIYSNEKYRKKLVKCLHNAHIEMNETAGSGISPLSWIYKNISSIFCILLFHSGSDEESLLSL